MNDKNGFFDSVSGNLSSARLIASFCIFVAVVFSFMLFDKATTATEAAASIGIVWTAIGTPSLIYLLQNKKAEIQHEEVKQETSALITKLPIS